MRSLLPAVPSLPLSQPCALSLSPSLPPLGQSYGCLRVSALIKILGVLYDVNPLLAFRTFAASSHTGMVIKVWKEGTLKGWGLDAVKSISLWTEDGAANNIKSSKLLGAAFPAYCVFGWVFEHTNSGFQWNAARGAARA